jgi:hypothetical protein
LGDHILGEQERAAQHAEDAAPHGWLVETCRSEPGPEMEAGRVAPVPRAGRAGPLRTWRASKPS